MQELLSGEQDVYSYIAYHLSIGQHCAGCRELLSRVGVDSSYYSVSVHGLQRQNASNFVSRERPHFEGWKW